MQVEQQKIQSRVVKATSEELTGDMKMLYDTVSQIIRQQIGGGPFTPDKVAALIAVIIRAVEDFSSTSAAGIPGAQKQQMALTIVQHVLKDFHDKGQISDDVFNDLVVGIQLLGPTLIDLAVAAWKKATAVAHDVESNGCKGCAKRNCCIL